MADIIIEGWEDLYSRLLSKTINPQIHGTFASFYTHARTYKDPAVCSCKKNKTLNTVIRLYSTLPREIQNEPWRSVARDLLGEGSILFKLNGVAVSVSG